MELRSTDVEKMRKSHYDDREIDLAKAANTIWIFKSLVLKVAAVFLIFGVSVAFLSPLEYESQMVLLPEAEEQQFGSGSASRLLQQFGGLTGINIGEASTGVINPLIYPQILGSTPFLMHLSDQNVYFSNLDTTATLYNFFHEIKSPSVFSLILGYTIGLPAKIKRAFSQPSSDKVGIEGDGDILFLTKEREEILEGLSKRIRVKFEEETGVVTITTEMPDAEAAALVNRLSYRYLEQFIANYRIGKLKENLAFIEERYYEAKSRFEASQMALANFRDKNVIVTTARARTEEERLQTNYNLAYNIYNSLAQQLEQAKIRVQAETPVFKILEPAKVPLEKSKPQRKLIVVASAFLGIIVGSAFVLFKYSSNFVFPNN